MRLKIWFLVVTMAASGCGNRWSRRSSAAVGYYFGTVALVSPDGKTPYGKTVSLVKREIRPEENAIVESVIQPPRKPTDNAREFIATMTRIAGTNEFEAADSGQTFSGRLSFEGRDWSLPRWTYDIRLKEGGRILGTGWLESEGIKTEKRFLGPDGKPTISMKEDLRSISRDEYARRRREMLPQ
jgi:hypothetical protein